MKPLLKNVFGSPSWSVFLFCLLALAAACGDDETGAALENNSDVRPDIEVPDTPTPVNNTTIAPPNNSTGECTGCLQGETCRTGLTSDACGADGLTCVACETGQVCTDGTCVDDAPTNNPPNNNPGCNSTNCDGCCDANGMCQSGTSATSCGSNGQACAVCEVGGCVEGVCSTGTACGPDNCDGCCDNIGICQTGDNNNACGTGGLACSSCGDGTCEVGMCVAPPCAETCDGCCMGEVCVDNTTAAQCGISGEACFACTGEESCLGDGTCGVQNFWKITILSAVVDYWWDDTFSAVDPYVYVELEYPTGTYIWAETTTKWDNNFPIWSETVLENIPEEAFANGILFEMWDEDGAFDDYICTWSYGVSSPLVEGIVQDDCPNDPWTTLRWSIEKM